MDGNYEQSTNNLCVYWCNTFLWLLHKLEQIFPFYQCVARDQLSADPILSHWNEKADGWDHTWPETWWWIPSYTTNTFSFTHAADMETPKCGFISESLIHSLIHPHSSPVTLVLWLLRQYNEIIVASQLNGRASKIRHRHHVPVHYAPAANVPAYDAAWVCMCVLCAKSMLVM